MQTTHCLKGICLKTTLHEQQNTIATKTHVEEHPPKIMCSPPPKNSTGCSRREEIGKYSDALTDALQVISFCIQGVFSQLVHPIEMMRMKVECQPGTMVRPESNDRLRSSLLCSLVLIRRKNLQPGQLGQELVIKDFWTKIWIFRHIFLRSAAFYLDVKTSSYTFQNEFYACEFSLHFHPKNKYFFLFNMVLL